MISVKKVLTFILAVTLCIMCMPDDLGLFTSDINLEQMRNGKIPTMYKYQNNPNDLFHLNKNGYMVMANIIYDHGKKLGYWK